VGAVAAVFVASSTAVPPPARVEPPVSVGVAELRQNHRIRCSPTGHLVPPQKGPFEHLLRRPHGGAGRSKALHFSGFRKRYSAAAQRWSVVLILFLKKPQGGAAPAGAH
jgi:hypothetical protein